jgi:molybdenum-dependent DNA-binding transcriptional regulator ModE
MSKASEMLVEATEKQLREMGALETMLGQQVLVIARGMAEGSGSELATLSKEHSRLMAAIAAGEKTTSDPLSDVEDSVRRKRERAAGEASA